MTSYCFSLSTKDILVRRKFSSINKNVIFYKRRTVWAVSYQAFFCNLNIYDAEKLRCDVEIALLYLAWRYLED